MSSTGYQRLVSTAVVGIWIAIFLFGAPGKYKETQRTYRGNAGKCREIQRKYKEIQRTYRGNTGKCREIQRKYKETQRTYRGNTGKCREIQ